jgi:hypothetical protein
VVRVHSRGHEGRRTYKGSPANLPYRIGFSGDGWIGALAAS